METETQKRNRIRSSPVVSEINAVLDRYGNVPLDLTASQKALCAAVDALTFLGREDDVSSLLKHWYSREGVLR